MWSNYLWELHILPWFFFFLLLLLAYSATNSTISSKTVESYYFYSSCFSILGHVFKCVKRVLAALESGWFNPAQAQAAVTVRADGETSPVLLHTRECHSTPFPSWSFITHQMQCLRKASQAIILCMIGRTNSVWCCRTNILPYLLRERNYAGSLEHNPWPWCGTAITLAFTHCFYWIALILITVQLWLTEALFWGFMQESC